MITVNFKTFQNQATVALNGKNAPTADARRQAESDKKAEERQNSTKVTLSDFGKRQSLALQMLKTPSSITDARKSAARAQAAQLKQQLENLKKIAASLGSVAAKSILRQIKQIAQQIRHIAEELGQSSSETGTSHIGLANAAVGAAEGGESSESGEGAEGVNSGAAVEEAIAREEPAAAETEETAEEKEAETEQAASAGAANQLTQAAAEAEKEIRDNENDGKNGQNQNNFAIQRRAGGGIQGKADAAMLRDLVNDLRQLLSWVKGVLQRKDKEDKENLKEIDKQLQATEELLQDMEASGESSDIDALPEAEALAAVDSVDTAVSATDASVASISVLA